MRLLTLRKYIFLAFLFLATSCQSDNSMNLQSSYIDTIDEAGITKNVVEDYGMVSSITKDQSALLQKAIDDLASKGGGKLIIPEGTYLFRSVVMGSNVHIVVDSEAILKPYWGGEEKVVMLNFSSKDAEKGEYIENCSIRSNGGQYTVDYSDIPKNQGSGIRFALAKMVKNFSIADAKILDNFSVYCGVTFSPSDVLGSLDWEVNRPTNGEMVNCSIYNGNPGYGLCQLHGARNLYFEDLYALGGVTLRLETGANTPYIGVYDVFGRNIKSENGRTAVMLGPHISQNGTVKIDGVSSIGSTYAVTVGEGHNTGKHAVDPNAKKGRFADDSKIINVHAVYGTHAQSSTKSLADYKECEYDLLRYDDLIPIGKWIIAPSVTAVEYGTKGSYTVTLENITIEGFPEYRGPIHTVPNNAPDGDTQNAIGMKIRSQIPQLKEWGGYSGEFFSPKLPAERAAKGKK